MSGNKPGPENRSGKFNQANRGSKSNNFETNTQTKDLVLAETVFLKPEEVKEITEEEIEDAIVYDNGVTSLDFMLPEEERNILEKNLSMYSDIEQLNKTLNIAKKNKVLSEDIKNLEIISELDKIIQGVNRILGSDENLEVLNAHIKKLLENGEVAKAYKEAGLMNKAMMDARQSMINQMKTNRSGKKAKIALKFTNDSGEDFQLGVEM